jgi:cardiolipin synthase
VASSARPHETFGLAPLRQLANQAFSRASGAPLREGNAIRLLTDAAENYPAWLEAIDAARERICLEMYIVHGDAQGERFAEALARKAREGVRVRVLYDWLGGFGKTWPFFWRGLRSAGAEVRVYNRPRLDQPLGWLYRDHRKLITVDDAVGFVTGLCIGKAWVGDPARGVEPWRDTGLEIRGPAVADLVDAFADSWAAAGEPLPEADRTSAAASPAGEVALRVVAGTPNTAGLLRVDQLVAAMAQKTLWLTDAYYAGTTSYVQALRAAAADGVDVRLLVPGASDIPALGPISRAGYRPLLEGGIRVFEWNGSMLHAKTAVADGRWARVGSTNLNIASWIGNRELDVVVEDAGFAGQMESMFVADLERATEIVLDQRHRVRAPSASTPGLQPRPPESHVLSRHRRGGGSGGRVMSGAARIGSTVTAAMTNRRVLEAVEAHIALLAGGLLALLAFLTWYYPRGVAYPIAVIAAWFAVALLIRGIIAVRDRR